MKFEVKDITIIDEVDADPEQPIFAQSHVEIGDVDSKGADIFFLDVCNLQWAKNNTSYKEIGFFDHILILSEISEDIIKAKIDTKFMIQDYQSLQEFVIAVENVMTWEYADYQ